MCLTTQAFALFLSMLSPDIVETSDHRVTIHASEGPTHWYFVNAEWCLFAADQDAPRVSL